MWLGEKLYESFFGKKNICYIVNLEIICLKKFVLIKLRSYNFEGGNVLCFVNSYLLDMF